MKEVILGWYATSTSLKENDIAINEELRAYCEHPI